MKLLLTFFYIILPLLGYINNEEKEDLTLRARIVCSGYPTISPVDGKYLSLEIVVKNNLDTIKTFWIYSCTWQDSFIIDDEKVEFCMNNCPSNYPIDIALNSGDSIVFNTILKMPDTARKDFRIGLISLNENELRNWFRTEAKSVEDARRQKREYLLGFKTYWSNVITTSTFTDSRGYVMNKFHH